jgi:putative transposase
VKYDPARRRSLRLKGYDYRQAGAYFVTICTQGRECLFGEVVDGQMQLNTLGEIVHRTWNDLPNHVAGMGLDEFVVMPNHVHGIIVMADESVVGAGSVGAGSEPAPTTTKRHGLPEIIRQFKTFSARRINEHRGTAGVQVWQRNYYEHIIRDEASLNRIREYIVNNPPQWAQDRENPDPVGAGSEPAPTEPAPTEPAPTEPAPTRMSSPPQDEPWRV